MFGLIKFTDSALRLCVFTTLISACVQSAVAQDVDYLKDIKPIFKARCFACHGALKQESGLRLDSGTLIRKGGDGGPAIVASKPQTSHLVERITAADEGERMPPEGKPLSAEQIELIKRWILQGARSPKGEEPEADPRAHWAFQRPVQSPLPVVKDQRFQNPIDLFIAETREQHGIRAVGEARRDILLRRVYLDLIGLPPTRDELHAFLADESPNAYERVVDRLLASPHYGERWGRHWMDIWRYSDWYGRRQVNDVRNSYPHIWRWRDWIVDSLNEDKGYDEMVAEMIATDELYPDDDERMPALGFIVRNWFSLNYDTWKQDLVEHTGKAFLGLRLNCCHCHDHKYDPISQEEYFRFRAFFEPLELRHDRVPGGPALTKYIRYKPSSSGSLLPIKAGLARVYDHYFDEKTTMYRLGDTRDKIDGADVTPGAPSIVGGDELSIRSLLLPPTAWYPALKKFALQDELAKLTSEIETAKPAITKSNAEQQRLATELKKAAQGLAAAKLIADDSETAFLRNADDLISWWRFEGADDASGFLADTSGNQHVLHRITAGDPEAAAFELKASGAKALLLTGIKNKQAAAFNQTKSFAYLAASGSERFYANTFTFETLVHFDVAATNFNQTIADYEGCWTLLHRGLDSQQFELRLRYWNDEGQLRDVASNQRIQDSEPLVMEVGKDYYVALTMASESVTLWVADLTTGSNLQSFRFPRNSKDADFAKLAKPNSETLFKIGNSDGTGRVVGLIDEVRYTRGALEEEFIAATVGQSSNATLRSVQSKLARLKSQHAMAEEKLAAAQSQLAAALAKRDAFQARVEVETAKYSAATIERPRALSVAAAKLEHQANIKMARAAVAQAKVSASAQKTADKPDEKMIKTAQQNLAAAQKALQTLEQQSQPRDYSALGPQYPRQSTGRRRALAKWLVDRKNPLTARVAVNHIWGRHFGTPLVASVFDFGRGGKLPTHPKLLDWLAVELMKGDEPDASSWNMKRLHRLIVTSQTYRLSSRVSAEHPNLELDSANTWYWRFSRKRLEAELVRDCMRYIAGQLDRRLGGEDIDPKQEDTSKRRSLYFAVYPEAGGTVQFMTLFNPPNPTDCYRRSETIVPQQALAMANSALSVQSAKELAAMVSEQFATESNADEPFVVMAFERILSRKPSPEESAACRLFLDRQRQLFTKENVANETLRARNSLIRVLLNHNDFITVH